MKWENEVWTVQKLISMIQQKKINLSPDYQRNPIWTSKAQRLLIDTILHPKPLPCFFILQLDDGKYEMVDGQQRSRSIVSFERGDTSSSSGHVIGNLIEDVRINFYSYELNIVLITDLEGAIIREFYSLVNSSGLHLNSPELRKAKYYDTRYFNLCLEIANWEDLRKLSLFSRPTMNRMNDIELILELIALIHSGVSEKKDNVDHLLERDFDVDIATILRRKFKRIVDVLVVFNEIDPLSNTRYRQRADLYTIVQFIQGNDTLCDDSFRIYYKVLLLIQDGISPSQEKYPKLRDYARNCVSQSNSKNARTERFNFINDLLRNRDQTPNEVQKQAIEMLLAHDELIEIEGAWTIDVDSLGED